MGTKHSCSFHLWCIHILENFSIHYILRKNTDIKIISFRQQMLQKCTLFFCCEVQLITVLLLICDSYMSWNTTLTFLKIVVKFSIFWFLLVFTKVYIFVKQKVWTLWLQRSINRKLYGSIKKRKFAIKMFFQIMLNEILKSCEQW